MVLMRDTASARIKNVVADPDLRTKAGTAEMQKVATARRAANEIISDEESCYANDATGTASSTSTTAAATGGRRRRRYGRRRE